MKLVNTKAHWAPTIELHAKVLGTGVIAYGTVTTSWRVFRDWRLPQGRTGKASPARAIYEGTQPSEKQLGQCRRAGATIRPFDFVVREGELRALRKVCGHCPA